MARFFVGPENIGQNIIIIKNAEDLHHMVKVLRIKEGDEIDVSDTVEWEYRAKVTSISKEEVQLKILDKQAFGGEPKTEVTLFQGIPKQGKMETIIQKCVELGVHDIVPVFMDRTVVTDKGNFNKKIDRWNKISSESVKQCRRGIIPVVSNPVKMNAVIDAFADYDLILFPYENEKGKTIKDALLVVTNPMYEEITGNHIEKVAIIIGPEGGFSESEARAITDAGGESVSLGKTILRTETAGMAALAMIMYELEL